jgi:hypothetical protein
MTIYIVWKISISGWSKEISAIFMKEENAINLKNELSKSNRQFFYEVEEKRTED